MADPIDRNYRLEDANEHRFGLTEHEWSLFAGRRYWITGGGTGYGAAVASALTLARASVIISSRRQRVLENTRAQILNLQAPGTISIKKMDVTKPASIDQAVRQLINTGPVDGIFVSAALPEPNAGKAPLRDLDPKDWDGLMNTNVKGAWLTTRALLSHFGERGYGRAVLVSSTAGWHSTPGFGPYNISKAALNALGANLATEAADAYPKADIRITVLDPGEAKTEMNTASSVSPFTVVPMTLRLLISEDGVTNGGMYHRDGRDVLNTSSHHRSSFGEKLGFKSIHKALFRR